MTLNAIFLHSAHQFIFIAITCILKNPYIISFFVTLEEFADYLTKNDGTCM